MAVQVFKDSAGVGDSLEQAARNGFLAKKDFLERCDARAFEQERDACQDPALARLRRSASRASW